MFKRNKGEKPEKEAKKARGSAKKSKRGGAARGDLSVVIGTTVNESVFGKVRDDREASRIMMGDELLGIKFVAEEVGGFGRGASTDVAEFVDAVHSGSIPHILTDEMAEEGYFVILPTAQGIGVMDEFEVSHLGSFEVVKVAEDGKVEPLGFSASYDQVDAFASQAGLTAEAWVAKQTGGATPAAPAGETTVMEAQPSPAETTVIDPAAIDPDEPSWDDIDAEDEEPEEDLPDDSAFDDDEDDDDDPFDDDDDDLEYDSGDDDFDDALYGDDDGIYGDDDFGYEDAGSGDPDFEVPAGPEVTVTQDDVERVISQMVDPDIDFAITSSTFDDAIGNAYEAWRIERADPDEKHVSDWLANQVNQVAAQANGELANLHDMNVVKARQIYMAQLRVLADGIDEKYSLTNEDGEMGREYRRINQEKQEALAKSDEVVDERVHRLQEDYDRGRAVAVEAAKKAAEKAYDDQYGAELRRQRRLEESRYRVEVEQDYSAKLQDLTMRRKDKVRKELANAESTALDAVKDVYEELRNEEMAVGSDYSNRIFEFIEAERDRDEKRIETLREEQERDDRVARMREELTSEFKARLELATQQVDALLAQQKASEASFKAQRKEEKATYKRNLKERDQKIARLEEQISDLHDRDLQKDGLVRQQYEGQLATLQDQLASANMTIQTMDDQNRRAGVQQVVFMIMLAIAMVAVGIWLGLQLQL